MGQTIVRFGCVAALIVALAMLSAAPAKTSQARQQYQAATDL